MRDWKRPLDGINCGLIFDLPMHVHQFFLKYKQHIFSSGHLFLFHLVSLATTMLSVKLLSSWFGPDKYAEIGKYLFVVAIGTGTFGNWMNYAISRYTPVKLASKENIFPLFFFCGQVILGSLLLVFLLFVFLKEYLYLYLGARPAAYTFLIVLFNSFFMLLLAMMNALSEFKVSSYLRLLERVFYLLIAFVATRILFLENPVQILDWLVLKGFASLLLLLITIRNYKPMWHFFRPIAERLRDGEKTGILKESLPFFFTTSTVLAANWLDFFIVSSTQSAFNTGLYFFAIQISNISIIAVNIPTTVITPKIITLLAEQKEQKISAYLKNVLPAIQWSWSLLIIFALLGSELLINNLFSVKFQGAVPYLQVILLGNVGLMSVQMLTPFVTFDKQMKSFMWLQLFVLVVNLPLAIIMMRYFHTYGIALAKAISMLCYTIVFLCYYQKIRRYLDWKIIASFLLPIAFYICFIKIGC